ncbi:hypothetical protein LWI29_032951 [Acer saccharum]|uniref:Reverse transcriptase Ty1/copia-type domain-containing protein n=1 Tax=Acer saccharum TaxID=4024 RepID=A0AA39WAG2_ACESA|nr:hypothetical protein LWI29_032951 [Acer saccharum]
MTDHINIMNTLFSQLTELGHKIEENERAELLLQSLPDSYDQLIINLTNNILVEYLVFDDVAAAVLEEESRRKNKEDRSKGSQQAEALTMTRGRSTERGPSGSHNHGYADGVKGYRLWDPTAHKVVISRDVIFVEDQLQKEEDNITSKENSETTDVQVENNPEQEDSISSEAEPEHETQVTDESEAPEVRRSTRERRPPVWHSEYVTESNVAYCLLTEDGEPLTFHEARNSSDASLWMTAMQEEIEALYKNKTWELVPLPHGRKAIGNRWIYKIKRDGNDQVERYRARLVMKGYAQKEDTEIRERFYVIRKETLESKLLTQEAVPNYVGISSASKGG